MKLSDNVLQFFDKQGFVLVSSIDEQQNIYCSPKGLVRIQKEGKLFIADLYKNKTYHNLQKNFHISVTAINEERFRGFTLQGEAYILPLNKVKKDFIASWENRITKRISRRVIKNVHDGIKAKDFFEAGLPQHPKYFIMMEVNRIVDLHPPPKKEVGVH